MCKIRYKLQRQAQKSERYIINYTIAGPEDQSADGVEAEACNLLGTLSLTGNQWSCLSTRALYCAHWWRAENNGQVRQDSDKAGSTRIICVHPSCKVETAAVWQASLHTLHMTLFQCDWTHITQSYFTHNTMLTSAVTPTSGLATNVSSRLFAHLLRFCFKFCSQESPHDALSICCDRF